MSLSHLVFITRGWLPKIPGATNALMHKNAAAHGSVAVQALIPTLNPWGKKCCQAVHLDGK